MANEMKKYRLKYGTHHVANPDFKVEVDPPEKSHYNAQAGDIVLLNDSQYEAFKDKFVPYDEEGEAQKAVEDKKLQDAKIAAAAMGDSVDPNNMTQEQKDAAAKAKIEAEKNGPKK